MDEKTLTEIEARAAAATEGPWMRAEHADEPKAIVSVHRRYLSLLGLRDGTAIIWDMADAEFIARAREDVPALVAEVRRLNAALESAREAVLAAGRRIIDLTNQLAREVMRANECDEIAEGE